MLNSGLTALIPDEPAAEFADVGIFLPPWNWRLFAKVVRGHQGVGRRVWTRPSASGGEWVVLDEIVQRVHSESDAEQIVESNRPTTRVVSELNQYALSVSDSGDGIRCATWTNDGLAGVWLLTCVGPFLAEAVGVSDGDVPDVEGVKQKLRGLQDVLGKEHPIPSFSFGRWAGVIWSLVEEIPRLVIFIFIPYLIGGAIGPAPLPFIAMLIGFVLYLYVAPQAGRSARHRRLLTVWGRVCAQNGDHDGTINRALAATGRGSPKA